MIIYRCDLCKKDIDDQRKISIYKFTEPIMGEKGIQYVPKEELYCGDCSDKIKKEIDKLKK